MNKTFKIQLASIDQCTGCSACVSVCPTGSISMKEDKEGFLQPQIDTDTCIKCHKCEKTCPVLKHIEIPSEFETQAFAAINKDEAVRMRSSSGGMFYALAKWTIEQGGVVFGARFDENWDVVHDYTETIEGIEPFMRSKYVQSRIGESYKQAKEFLKEGRNVLYVGTPCQIGGLKSYLNKEYDNLLAVDFICHGVPSPKVWRKYLKDTKGKDKILEINFRDKQNGWLDFQCVTTTTTTTREKQMENTYFRGFLYNIYLRRSCYKCQFARLRRLSDLTLADYWGVQDKCPEMYDNKGTSAIIVHSSKGQMAIANIRQYIALRLQTINDIIANNKSMTESEACPSRRSKFFFFSTFLPFHKLSFAIDKDWMIARMLRKIKK